MRRRVTDMSRWTSCEQERLDRMVIFLILKASYLKVVDRDGCFYIGKVVPTATYNTVQFLYIAVVSRQRP